MHARCMHQRMHPGGSQTTMARLAEAPSRIPSSTPEVARQCAPALRGEWSHQLLAPIVLQQGSTQHGIRSQPSRRIRHARPPQAAHESSTAGAAITSAACGDPTSPAASAPLIAPLSAGAAPSVGCAEADAAAAAKATMVEVGAVFLLGEAPPFVRCLSLAANRTAETATSASVGGGRARRAMKLSFRFCAHDFSLGLLALLEG